MYYTKSYEQDPPKIEMSFDYTNYQHQLGHLWQHYVRVVPCMMFINGRNNTFFAGSWTLVVRSLPKYLVMKDPDIRQRTYTNSCVSVVWHQPTVLVLTMSSSTTLPRTSLANTCCYPMELGIELKKGEERERSIRSRCCVSSACLQYIASVRNHDVGINCSNLVSPDMGAGPGRAGGVRMPSRLAVMARRAVASFLRSVGFLRRLPRNLHSRTT